MPKKKKKYKGWSVQQLEMITSGKYKDDYLAEQLGCTKISITSVRREVKEAIERKPKVCLPCLQGSHGVCKSSCACPICWTAVAGRARLGHVQYRYPRKTPRVKKVPTDLQKKTLSETNLGYPHWTAEEEGIIIRNLNKSDEEIAGILHRTPGAVRNRRLKLIRKVVDAVTLKTASQDAADFHRDKWLPEELEVLQETLDWDDNRWLAERRWVCELILPRHGNVQIIGKKRMAMIRERREGKP